MELYTKKMLSNFILTSFLTPVELKIRPEVTKRLIETAKGANLVKDDNFFKKYAIKFRQHVNDE